MEVWQKAVSSRVDVRLGFAIEPGALTCRFGDPRKENCDMMCRPLRAVMVGHRYAIIVPRVRGIRWIPSLFPTPLSLSSDPPCVSHFRSLPSSRATPGEGATRAGDDTPARPVVAIRCPAARDPVGIAGGSLSAYAHSRHCQHARRTSRKQLIVVAVLSFPWDAYAYRTHTRENREKADCDRTSTQGSHSRRVEGGPSRRKSASHRPDAHHESRYPRCRGEGIKKKERSEGTRSARRDDTCVSRAMRLVAAASSLGLIRSTRQLWSVATILRIVVSFRRNPVLRSADRKAEVRGCERDGRGERERERWTG